MKCSRRTERPVSASNLDLSRRRSDPATPTPDLSRKGEGSAAGPEGPHFLPPGPGPTRPPRAGGGGRARRSPAGGALLPDAERGEQAVEHVLDVDMARDLADRPGGEADVLGDEF